MSLLRLLVPALSVACAATARAQQSAPTALNWNPLDSAHIASLRSGGHTVAMPNVVLWAPRDSISLDSLRAVARRVDAGIAALREMIGGPWPWQRIGTRAIDYYLVPTRVISHASGKGAVFISIWRVHQGVAPLLHEGLHELLEPLPRSCRGVHRFADTAPSDGRAAALVPRGISRSPGAAGCSQGGDRRGRHLWRWRERSRRPRVCRSAQGFAASTGHHRGGGATGTYADAVHDPAHRGRPDLLSVQSIVGAPPGRRDRIGAGGGAHAGHPARRLSSGGRTRRGGPLEQLRAEWLAALGLGEGGGTPRSLPAPEQTSRPGAR
ncbi:MAG: hypothetical protein IPF47_17240 [Gemmatimonadetes bacterium]|nr:hypothetical protein [Gemmatimonadota bacterium]